MPKLTERGAAAAKPRDKVYRLSDGGGLLLEVRPGGGRAWLFRYMIAGRRRDMGLGAYPAVGLAEARKKARAAAQVAEGGGDPIGAREAEKVRAGEEAAARDDRQGRTFRAVAEKLVDAQKPGWTSSKTAASWALTLNRHAYPVLADLPIGEVDREHVTRALAAVWTAQPATARKLQRRIASVLDFATALGWRSTDNPAAGRVLRLTKALPSQPPERKQPSLPWQRVPAFLEALAPMMGTASLTLRFAILTAVRSAEVRHATWSEIDLVNRVWTIPAQRMKGGRARAIPPHRVPLSSAMVAVLRQVMVAPEAATASDPQMAAMAAALGKDLIFPSPTGVALSDAALGACVRRMNEALKPGQPPWQDVDERPIVPHGFRRSFRSWVDDIRPSAGEAAEKALAHDDANAVRAAYRGSDMLEQRRPLMEDWGCFCMGAMAS
jgi:integrase